MLTAKEFLEIVDGAKGRRADVEVSRSAGLPSNTLSAMRGGRIPSLERAARVADAVELELVVRRKGETIDQLAVELAILCMFEPDAATEYVGPRNARRFSQSFAKNYRWFHSLMEFSPEKRRKVREVFEAALGRELSAGHRGAKEAVGPMRELLLGELLPPAIQAIGEADQEADE